MDGKNAIEVRNVSKSFKVRFSGVNAVGHAQDRESDEGSSGTNPKKRLFGFRKEKQENTVLDDVSFTVKKGEVVGIIGRNGSGKSTLLKMISRIMEPDTGSIEINGNVASILELGMGFHQDMTGRENIFIKGSMYGFSKDEMNNRIQSIIDYSGLEDYIDLPLRTYSSGMTGRLAFALMINVDADILLVDEVLSTGDAQFSAKASMHFKRMAKTGKTIIIVSHSSGMINEMCSRAIWIEDGRIFKDGPAKAVCDAYQREMLESFDITHELAVSGVPDAQYRLARMYKDGNKTDINIVEAAEWMRSAAEQNHAQAQLEYGDMLFDGAGIEQDIAQAKYLYQMSADRGNNDARIKVAALTGDTEDNVREKTLKLFEELASRGDPHMQYRHGDLLMRAALNDEDRKKASGWFSKASEKGHLEAMFQLGLIYRDGRGANVDMKKSIEYFREAAESGHVGAQSALAELFLNGTKTDKNEKESFKWHLRSAVSGNARSQYQVAVMYRDGIGTDIDIEESNRWFRIFSHASLVNHQLALGDVLKNIKLGTDLDSEGLYILASETYNSHAMLKLGILYKDMKPKPDMKRSVLWLECSAKLNNVAAMMILGDILSKGMDIEPDPEKAFGYYHSASLAGNPTASYHVAMMYKEGFGVNKDMKKYREYLSMAIDGGVSKAFIESSSELDVS